MHRLYDYLASGNGYKVRLILRLLGIPFERVEVDIVRGESRTAEFLAKTPEGRIPVLRLDDGTHLFESNAILCYLAEATPYLPEGRLARAQALQWMFWEQYSHEPNVATVRHWVTPRTSPSTRTRTSRRKAGSTSPRSRACAPGSIASAIAPASLRSLSVDARAHLS